MSWVQCPWHVRVQWPLALLLVVLPTLEFSVGPQLIMRSRARQPCPPPRAQQFVETTCAGGPVERERQVGATFFSAVRRQRRTFLFFYDSRCGCYATNLCWNALASSQEAPPCNDDYDVKEVLSAAAEFLFSTAADGVSPVFGYGMN